MAFPQLRNYKGSLNPLASSAPAGPTAYELNAEPGTYGITGVLAGMKTDIRDAQARTFDDRTASIDLTLRIQDLKHLEKVVKSIRGVSGVLDVERQTVAR